MLYFFNFICYRFFKYKIGINDTFFKFSKILKNPMEKCQKLSKRKNSNFLKMLKNNYFCIFVFFEKFMKIFILKISKLWKNIFQFIKIINFFKITFLIFWDSKKFQKWCPKLAKNGVQSFSKIKFVKNLWKFFVRSFIF